MFTAGQPYDIVLNSLGIMGPQRNWQKAQIIDRFALSVALRILDLPANETTPVSSLYQVRQMVTTSSEN